MPFVFKNTFSSEDTSAISINQKFLLLKLADVLRQENLISFEEQERGKRLIRESEDI